MASPSQLLADQLMKRVVTVPVGVSGHARFALKQLGIPALPEDTRRERYSDKYRVRVRVRGMSGDRLAVKATEVVALLTDKFPGVTAKPFYHTFGATRPQYWCIMIDFPSLT